MNHYHPQDYPTPASDSDESTASKLERLSRCVADSINARDFAFTSKDGQELLAHTAADFMCHLDSQAQPITLQEQVAAWQKRTEQFPDFRFELQEISSDVNERSGQASVFMSLIWTGLSDVNLHAITELKWRKMGNWWELYWVYGMRSMPEPGMQEIPGVGGDGNG